MATSKKTTFIDIERIHKYTCEKIGNFILPRHITGKKYYLYIHVRLDKNEPFYIGIGTISNGYYYRATDSMKRNTIWKRIVTKSNFDVFIVEESDNKQDILKREIQYISLFRKIKNKNGILSNLTDGGEGSKGHSGIVWTEERREKIRNANRKRVIKNSTREKLRLALQNRGIINKRKS